MARHFFIEEKEGWNAIVQALAKAQTGDVIALGAGRFTGETPLTLPSCITLKGQYRVADDDHASETVPSSNAASLDVVSLAERHLPTPVIAEPDTVLEYHGRGNMFLLEHVENITLEGLHVNHRGTTEGDADTDVKDQEAVILVTKGKNIHVQHCVIQGQKQFLRGLYFNNQCYDYSIKYCRFIDLKCGISAIESTGLIDGCSFQNHKANGIIIINNSIEAANQGITTVSSNLVSNCNLNGIKIINADVIAKENICERNFGNGIYIDVNELCSGRSFQVDLEYNECTENLRFGILTKSAQVKARHNYCARNIRSGIAAGFNKDASSFQFSITLEDNISVKNKGSGIFLASAKGNVFGNSCEKNAENGITVINNNVFTAEKPKLCLSKNFCINNNVGIHISESNVTADQNICRENNTFGICVEMDKNLLTPILDISLERNYCTQNGYAGLALFGSNVYANENILEKSKVGIAVTLNSSCPEKDFQVKLNKNYCTDNHFGMAINSANTIVQNNICEQNINGISVSVEKGFSNYSFQVVLSNNQAKFNGMDGFCFQGADIEAYNNISFQNHGDGFKIERCQHTRNVNKFKVSLMGNKSSRNKRYGLISSGAHVTISKNQIWDNFKSALRLFWPKWGNDIVDDPSGSLIGLDNYIHSVAQSAFIEDDVKHIYSKSDIGYTLKKRSAPGLFFNVPPENLDLETLNVDITQDSELVFRCDLFAQTYGHEGFSIIWTEDHIFEAEPPKPKISRPLGYNLKTGHSKSVSGKADYWLLNRYERYITPTLEHSDAARKTRLTVLISPEPQDTGRLADHAIWRSGSEDGTGLSHQYKPPEAENCPAKPDFVRIGAPVIIGAPTEAGGTASQSARFDQGLMVGTSLWRERVSFLAQDRWSWAFLILALAVIGFFTLSLPHGLEPAQYSVRSFASQITSSLGLWAFIGLGLSSLALIPLLNKALPAPLKFGHALIEDFDKMASPRWRLLLKMITTGLGRRFDKTKRWARWAARRLYSDSTVAVLIIEEQKAWVDTDTQIFEALLDARPQGQGLWVVLHVPGRSYEKAAIKDWANYFDEAEILYADTEERMSFSQALNDQSKTEGSDYSNVRAYLSQTFGFDALEADNDAFLNELRDKEFTLFDLWPALIFGASVERRPQLTLEKRVQKEVRNIEFEKDISPYFDLFLSLWKAKGLSPNAHTSLEARLEYTKDMFHAAKHADALHHTDDRQKEYIEGRPTYRRDIFISLQHLWSETNTADDKLGLEDYVAFGLACGLQDALTLIEHNASQDDVNAAWHGCAFLLDEAESLMGRVKFFDFFPMLQDRINLEVKNFDEAYFLEGSQTIPIIRRLGLTLRAMPRNDLQTMFNPVYKHLLSPYEHLEPSLAYEKATVQIHAFSFGWGEELIAHFEDGFNSYVEKTPSFSQRLRAAKSNSAIIKLLEDHKELGSKALYIALRTALLCINMEDAQGNIKRSKLFNTLISIRNTLKDKGTYELKKPTKIESYESFSLFTLQLNPPKNESLLVSFMSSPESVKTFVSMLSK